MKITFFIFSLVIINLLVGCASKPSNIKAQYVSPMLYQHYDCEQIVAEKNRIDREVGTLYETLKNKSNNDTLQAASAVLLWPMLFTLEGGDGPDAIEYGRLKGQVKALEDMSIQKKCGLNFQKYHQKN